MHALTHSWCAESRYPACSWQHKVCTGSKVHYKCMELGDACLWSIQHCKNDENLKQIFPEKKYRGLSPNIHIQGLIEFVQHFAYRGSSHRRKGAARHVINKVVSLNIARLSQ
jgi:hypothetical protein